MTKGALLLTCLGTIAIVAVLWPKKASASPLGEGAGPVHDGDGDQPKNANEVYSLAMNPNFKDSEKVHEYAVWLASSGQRPDWAAAVERRAQDLRAEGIMAVGLKLMTDAKTVSEDIIALEPTHPEYAEVLRKRMIAMSGGNVVSPVILPLRSGGSLTIDFSIYSPAASAGPVGSQSGGSTPTSPSQVAPPTYQPTPAGGAAQSPPIPTATPSGAQPSGATPQVVVKPPPGQASVPSITTAELDPTLDKYGTIALARVLLDEQTKPNWKYVSQAVKDWQSKVGLTADGKFGPGAALRMAQEVGALPWVRYWPVGSASKQAAVSDYRGRLKAYALSIAPKNEAHAAALIISADRESGQGWPTAPAKAPAPAMTDAQIQAAIISLGVLKGGM